ncbi:MAG: efflux RND transporter periplasmic adaptor subunit [Opitutae bacterium]|nr:efflux RND transporter periplasmic adaptor subunit [Opitutae bacterium]
MASSGKTRVLVVSAALLALAAAAYFYVRREREADRLPEYTTTTVTRGDIVQTVTATGQLDAVLSVDVGSQVSGLITKLYADFNTRVTAGQKLAEIDPATFQQRLRQAEANLASAEASYFLADLNAKRTQELFTKSLVTQQDSDQAQAQLKQAAAQLLINKASVENARVDLGRCTIFSPIAGIVISKQTEVGKTVASSLNVPTLFTIANDLAKMQITAAVAEADIGAVDTGQAVTFTVDAFPTRTFSGVITQVRNAPKNTNNVVTYETIISVDNHDLKLRPGMTASVAIVVARRDGVLRVPNAALRVRLPEGFAVVAPAASAPPDAGAGAAPSAATPAPGAEPRGGGRGGMFGNLPPEQQQKMREIMAEVGYVRGAGGPPTPEQREQIRKLMLERGLTPPEPPPARPGEVTYTNRVVYRLPGGNPRAVPEAVPVRVGITDGLASEIAGAVKAGDVLLTSVSVPNAKPAAGPANNPFGGGRRF